MRYIFSVILCLLSLGLHKASAKENPGSGEIIVSSFVIESLRLSSDGMLSWTASNEQGALPYFVEQYILDKWVKVAAVMGIGTSRANSYSVQVVLSSGENNFRVRQRGQDKMSRFSEPVSYFSKKSAVSYRVANRNSTLIFSKDTYFLIYNPYGEIVKQGYGNSLDISNFKKGYYCLVYDNKLGGFEKKKVWLIQNIFRDLLYPFN